MVQAFKITGKTYPHRRELRKLNCLFDRDEKAYIIAADKSGPVLEYVANHSDLESSPYEATEDQITPATGERLREIRQDRQDRRAERLRDRADAAERRADKHSKRISPGELDFLSLGEPIKIGHHSERKHRKLIERVRKATDDEMSERVNADKLRRRADWLTSAVVKGDAERKRQERREANSHIERGDEIHNAVWGTGVVIKINKKTFTVWYAERKFYQTIDKSRCKLVKKGTGPVEIPRRFKKGDLVNVTRITRQLPGVIIRQTPKGYTVDYEWFGKTERGTFSEYQVAERATSEAVSAT